MKDVSVIFCLYSLLGYYSFTVLLNRDMQRKILKYFIEYNRKNISTLIWNIIISLSKMSKFQFVHFYAHWRGLLFFVTVGHACSDFFKRNDYQSKDMNIHVVEKWQKFSISIFNDIILKIQLILDELSINHLRNVLISYMTANVQISIL